MLTFAPPPSLPSTRPGEYGNCSLGARRWLRFGPESEFLVPHPEVHGIQPQNSAGSKQGEIGVRCCLQFNQSAFNHSICFDVARLQISRFRPEPNTFPLGPTLACEAAAVSVCHPAVNSRLPEPRKPPGTGALIFLRTAPSIAARRVPPDHPSAVG